MPMTMDTSIRRNITLAAVTIASGVGSLMMGLGMVLIAVPIFFVATGLGLLNLIEAIMVLVDKEGRRLGDKFAGTKVIESEV